MDWMGFALAVFLVEITPGPNMAWLVSLTLTEGRKAGLSAVAGVAIGLCLNAALSSAGLSALLAQAPLIGTWMGVGAGFMMLWLAWRGWLQLGESSPAAIAGRSSRRDVFTGIMLNLFNAKAAVFFLTIVPQFLPAQGATLRDIMTLGFTSAAVATLVHLGLVLGAGRLRPFLQGPGHVRTVRRTLALAMVGVAIWFFHSALA